jgi:hypothetical protein
VQSSRQPTADQIADLPTQGVDAGVPVARWMHAVGQQRPG